MAPDIVPSPGGQVVDSSRAVDTGREELALQGKGQGGQVLQVRGMNQGGQVLLAKHKND